MSDQELQVQVRRRSSQEALRGRRREAHSNTSLDAPEQSPQMLPRVCARSKIETGRWRK